VIAPTSRSTARAGFARSNYRLFIPGRSPRPLGRGGPTPNPERYGNAQALAPDSWPACCASVPA
jgi:hypothetical protein